MILFWQRRCLISLSVSECQGTNQGGVWEEQAGPRVPASQIQLSLSPREVGSHQEACSRLWHWQGCRGQVAWSSSSISFSYFPTEDHRGYGSVIYFEAANLGFCWTRLCLSRHNYCGCCLSLYQYQLNFYRWNLWRLLRLKQLRYTMKHQKLKIPPHRHFKLIRSLISKAFLWILRRNLEKKESVMKISLYVKNGAVTISCI